MIPIEELRINILGDSITWGYEGPPHKQYERAYPGYLKEILGAKEVRAYGINGSTVAKGNRSIAPMVERYQEMSPKVDLVIVFGGSNDYDWIPLGQKGDQKQDTFYGALEYLCIKLKEKYPSALLLYITPLKRGLIDENTKAVQMEDLEEWVEAIQEVCKENQIPVFDLYHCCDEIKEETLTTYMPDGTHPTQEYHKILGKKIAQYIQKEQIGTG